MLKGHNGGTLNPTRDQLEDALMTLMDTQDTIYTLMVAASGDTQTVLSRAVSSTEDAAADLQDLIDALGEEDEGDE